MQLRLTPKLIALVVVPLLLFTAAVTAVILAQEDGTVASMAQLLREDSNSKLKQVVADVNTMCANAQEATAQRLALNADAFRRLVDEGGGIHVDEARRVSWTAKEQVTGASQTLELGALRLGKTWLGQVSDVNESVAVVDRVRQLLGGSATVFQRMNEQGDMLRVATNVVGKDGRRAIGSYVSHRGADGGPNPIIERVLAGEAYSGRAFVVDEWYLARYTPLRDAQGRVFGMLFVGVRLDALASLKRSISQIQLGKSGYVWVVGAAGDERGRYIVSKGQSRDGESLLQVKDATGRYFMQEFVTRAKDLRGDQVFVDEYPWQNPGEKTRDKLVVVGYFEPWNWVIGASMYRDEADANVVAFKTSMSTLVKDTLGLCLVGVALLIGVATWLSRRMVRPLTDLAGVALLLSQGRVDVNIEHRSGDEIGSLANAFRSLVQYLAEAAEVARAIAAGNLQVEITPRSDGDVLANNMAHATGVLRGLLGEVDDLTRATQAGDLSKRGDTSKYRGGYAELLTGMNGLLAGVVDPIHEVGRVLERLAARDLVTRARDGYRGEYAKMVVSLNTAADNLRDSMLQVAAASGQVATASSEIAASSQSVAQGASEQASALEQTSSALIEMAASTKRNAGSAQHANELAKDAKSASSTGAEDVREMLTAMQQIRSAAEGTAAIIRDINDVAFQTNLLALNAAVEAARAGEAGRGFAVVAEQVRNLAHRSKEAACKTETLISASVELARRGENISERVNEALQRIILSVDKVTEIVGEIAETSGAQADGIAQSTKAMASIDQSTQLAAANSEQTSSAAEELASQAEELAGLVRQFRLQPAEQTSERRALTGGARQRGSERAPANLTVVR
jgi:methyl-accepting chemotaxis protein